jgi:demethylmenaquinone methyltransferase/2-methoxy-6-polyprenyl-1,4-benzoquinol methylase
MKPPKEAAAIREMFDRIHQRYDFLNHVMSFGLDFYWRKRAIMALGLKPGQRVVDLCCGTGDLSFALAKKVGPTGKVVGVDFAGQMLDVARHKFQAKQNDWDVTFIQGDACKVPLEGKFDAATLAFGPRNIHDLDALWSEMKRLVRPGGKVLSLELTRPRGILAPLHHFYTHVIVPLMGKFLSGDSDAYGYLCKSVAKFMDSQQLADSMRANGLLDVQIIPLQGGIVTIHVGRVPEELEAAQA